MQGTVSLSGSLGVRKAPRHAVPGFWWHVRQWLLYRWREIPLTLLIFSLPLLRRAVPGLTVVWGETRLKLVRGDGTAVDYGLVSRHLVTTAGKQFLAACMDNTSEPEVMKYHGFGTGTTAASTADTALQTELTTQYATDNTRPTGSQTHSAATYTTAATFSPDAGGTIAVTEWGLFSQAANSGGTLLDRIVFSAVNVVASSDSIVSTYTLTVG